jgi:5-methylcytosine-specific restriction endonuclease McrA
MRFSKSEIRARFRKAVFKRDGHRCAVCGIAESEVEKLDAHHITDRNEMPNGGYVPENGISLCPKCHIKAEIYHTSDGWDWARGYHPNSLYFRIGTSPETAVEASERLA